MQNIFQNELTVAILMDDLASAKEIAHCLRQNNILAHHYKNLDEFWVSTNIETPDLVIVDVTKMSQGSIQFRQHPKVLDQSLCYVFFSKDSTKILLQSTLGLKPFGFIHNDLSLPAQISGLIERRREILNAKKMMKELEGRVSRLQVKSQRMITDRNSAEEFKTLHDFVKSFCMSVEEDALKSDFTTTLMNKLEQWDSIDSYALYELNQSGQKLVSPESARKKAQSLPSLWLGEVNHHGIAGFAQDMATQVANDIFESEPRMLKVHAGHNNPELILFITSTDEKLTNFPWTVFEDMLSSGLRRIKLQQQLPKLSSQFLPMWEALDEMDHLQKSGVNTDQRVVCLSLVPMVDIIKKRLQNKFHWTSFFNDFFLQLSGRLNKTTKLSLFGPWQVIFFIPNENLESESHTLQAFIKQFGYWKFFEDKSMVLSEEMLPTLKFIPASSAQYLRIFEKEFERSLPSVETQKPARTRPREDVKRMTT